MGMNSHAGRGYRRRRLLEDLRQFPGERSPVGIAEDDRIGPRLHRSLHGPEGISGVVLISVEEMLGIVDHLFSLRFQVADGVIYQGEVLIQRDPQDLRGVQVPALSENGHRRGIRLDEGLYVGTGLGRQTGSPRAAEGRQAGIREGHLTGHLEEPHVTGVRSRPSPLDVMETDIIQSRGNPQLVLRRKADLVSLCPVP